MSRRIQQTVAAIAALAALALGGAALAGAAGDSSDDDRGPAGRSNEQPLTGSTATKVKEAVLAELAGATVLRVETDSGGAYEAHVRKADGTPVEVKVSKRFEVTSVDEHRHPGPGGPCGPGGRGGPGGPGGDMNEEALTGTIATKVKEAALAKVPGGTVLRLETDSGGAYEAHVRKADGTPVEVKVSKQFEVTAVEELRHP